MRARVSDRLAGLGVPRPIVEVEPVEGLERSPGGKLQMIVPDGAAQSTRDVTAAGAGRTWTRAPTSYSSSEGSCTSTIRPFSWRSR